MECLARVLRLKDAPKYLGMDIKVFNELVRPHLSEFPIGKQGIGFDRLDLDAWFEEYKSRNRRLKATSRGGTLWDARKHQVSLSEEGSGKLTNSCTDKEFARALERVTLKKQKRS